VGAGSATAAVLVATVASVFVIVVVILLAVDPRMTIHHSAWPAKQVNSQPGQM
jgi:hypothetical protein